MTENYNLTQSKTGELVCVAGARWPWWRWTPHGYEITRLFSGTIPKQNYLTLNSDFCLQAFELMTKGYVSVLQRLLREEQMVLWVKHFILCLPVRPVIEVPTDEPLTEDQALFYFRDVVLGIEYCKFYLYLLIFTFCVRTLVLGLNLATAMLLYTYVDAGV